MLKAWSNQKLWTSSFNWSVFDLFKFSGEWGGILLINSPPWFRHFSLLILHTSQFSSFSFRFLFLIVNTYYWCCASESGSAWIRIKLKGRIRIRIRMKVISWIRMSSICRWQAKMYGNLSTFSRYCAFIKKLGFGNGSALKWQAGSGSGSASRKFGSATLLIISTVFIRSVANGCFNDNFLPKETEWTHCRKSVV